MKLSQAQAKQLLQEKAEEGYKSLSNWNVQLTLRGFEYSPNFYIAAKAEGLAFGYYAIEWHGPHKPVLANRPHHYLSWEMLEREKGRLFEEIEESFMRVLFFRKRQFKTCSFCKRRKPREHMHAVDGKWVCHACAERELGFIH